MRAFANRWRVEGGWGTVGKGGMLHACMSLMLHMRAILAKVQIFSQTLGISSHVEYCISA